MPLNKVVATTDTRFFSESMKEILREAGAELKLNPCRSPDEIIARVSTAEAIITTSAVFSRRVLENLERCRFIIRCGVGIDNIDVASATARGILVAYLPDWYIEDVGNHIMTLILNSCKKITLTDHLVRKGNYTFDKIQPLKRLSSKVLGLIGFGKISKYLLPKFMAFNFHILTYDPYLPTPPQGVKKVGLTALLQQSDLIVLNCPLTEENRGMIGEQALNLMKPDAYIINTARGPLIDEVALANALQNKRIAGAALDVVCQEPIQSSNPLLQFDNVLITPHIAWYSEESMEEGRRRAAEDVVRVLKGDLPGYPANPEAFDKQHKKER